MAKKKIGSLGYSESDLERIEQRVAALKENTDWRMDRDYDFANDAEVRVFEVISRYRGDAGLSENAVCYLTAGIMHVISQLTSDLERAGDKNAKLEAENIRLNSELNQRILAPVISPEPPYDEFHYKYHTPAYPCIGCPNCIWLKWTEE